MRCSSCNADTPGKTLKGIDYRCPNCGHQFVAVKKRDGISDLTIRKEIDKVSAKSTLWYRADHLAYQLLRRHFSRRSGRMGCFVTAVVLAAIGFLLLWKLWPLGLFLFALAGLALVVRPRPAGAGVFELVQRYEAVNPPERHVPHTEQLIERERGRETLLAGLRKAGRILVCQNRHDAHFFIANDFHLQHACPVAGPDGNAVDGFPELKTRLERSGALDVFVLHDFTPAGSGFMRRMRQLPDIARRRDPVTLIEMGFDDRHLPLFKGALWPLERIAGSRDASPGSTWKGTDGAQVTALLPALMLAAAGVSLADRAPIRVPAKDEDDLDDDSDSGDSE